MRDLIGNSLKKKNYRVATAPNGKRGVEIAKEIRPILIITDWMMPGMGGRELSELFRARYPAVRILFMSAYTEDEIILQGVRVAEVDFIPKPFTVQGLRDKVRTLIDRNGAE